MQAHADMQAEVAWTGAVHWDGGDLPDEEGALQMGTITRLSGKTSDWGRGSQCSRQAEARSSSNVLSIILLGDDERLPDARKPGGNLERGCLRQLSPKKKTERNLN